MAFYCDQIAVTFTVTLLKGIIFEIFVVDLGAPCMKKILINLDNTYHMFILKGPIIHETN